MVSNLTKNDGAAQFAKFWKLCIESNSACASKYALRKMLENILSLLGSSDGYVLEIDEVDCLRLVETSRKGSTFRNFEQCICSRLVLQAISEQKAISKNAGDCNMCDLEWNCCEPTKLSHILCAPIDKTNGTQFVLYISRSQEQQSFSEFDQRTINFICKQIAPEYIRSYLKNLQGDNDSEKLEKKLRREHNFDFIVGHNPKIIRLLDLIVKAKDLDVPILIEGESGTGKEMIARAVHYNSKRKKEPLVTINCGAIPENLLESELFGYEKGAFTGATTAKIGQVQVAGSGTIFLDEIDDLNFNLQVKLLRVLQWGEYTPVGSSTAKKTSARFIASSKHNLKELVKKGTFRDDLFYRLNVLRFSIPPLRERITDIPDLCDYFLAKHCKKLGKPKLEISQAGLNALMNYEYPGNIRELENILQRAIILTESAFIDAEHLPFEIQYNGTQQNRLDHKNLKFKEAKIKVVEEFEKEFLHEKLVESDGVILRAAKRAGMYEANFRQKLKKYGLLTNSDASKIA